MTHTPGPASSLSMADTGRPVDAGASLAEPQPWQLDPLPLIVDEREWSSLEAGMVQRAELLDAILADLYGPQDLLAHGHLPVAAVLDHSEFLRPLVGTEALTSQGLFMIAVDLGRGRRRDLAGDLRSHAGPLRSRATRCRTGGWCPGCCPRSTTRPICTG